MKIVAFTRVHYGVDYLPYVIRSTADFADQHIVLYTEETSRGYQHTSLPCPDSRHDLYRAARNAAGGRLMWADEMPATMEGVFAMRPDADIFLELDADEIPDPSLLNHIRERAEAGELQSRMYRLPFVHYWRSFAYACRDTNYPVRLFVPRNYNEDIEFWPDSESHGVIHHFGYARSLEDMRYKVEVSAHRPEFRREWWSEIFLKFPERLTDLHPVCVDGFWNAEPIDKRTLPLVLMSHPYLNREVIE